MRFRLMRMRRITWPVRWGVNFANIFLESYVGSYWFVYSLWNFGGFTVKVKMQKKSTKNVAKSPKLLPEVPK